ncbi:MAG: hypothetical protein FJ358_05710 [Thaumarchaeota archaeon]|nr:hypothetical protein [Nitrososphaerota archaeon]
MEYWTLLVEIILSLATIVFTGYHAYLVMSQRLSYFHSVRYLLFLSYIAFSIVVATELLLAHLHDLAVASVMIRTSISAVIVAASLLAIASQVLRLQVQGHENPYKELKKKTSFAVSYNRSRH